jgi:hypothetical protein
MITDCQHEKVLKIKSIQERSLAFEDALTTLNKTEQCREKNQTAKHVKICYANQNVSHMQEVAL